MDDITSHEQTTPLTPPPKLRPPLPHKTMAEGSSISNVPVDTTSDATRTTTFRPLPVVDVSRPLRLTEQMKKAEKAPMFFRDDPNERDTEETGTSENEGVFDVDDDDFVPVGQKDFPWYLRSRAPARQTELHKLHPFVQLLSVSDIDSCEKVEAAFPEHERSTREKTIYRLTKCPELSLGVLSRPRLAGDGPVPPATLIAHILATRTPAPAVTDASMGFPKDWRTNKKTLHTSGDEEPLGHQDEGATIAIHSLAVLPEHQGKGVGKTLMKAYIQRIKDAMIADRIALLAHDHLIPFYTSLGFQNVGRSECTFGGGGWNNLILDLRLMP
ncbi:hypothetical protein FQN57_001126 [Myotisia sp. PD_48]|nr:hypothetical protein FQN57_001126 [Myotisia sp. PD_48]